MIFLVNAVFAFASTLVVASVLLFAWSLRVAVLGSWDDDSYRKDKSVRSSSILRMYSIVALFVALAMFLASFFLNVARQVTWW